MPYMPYVPNNIICGQASVAAYDGICIFMAYSPWHSGGRHIAERERERERGVDNGRICHRCVITCENMPQRRHVYNMGEYATQRRRQAYDAHMPRHMAYDAHMPRPASAGI